MTTTKALNGLTPSRRYSGGANTLKTKNYRIKSGCAGSDLQGSDSSSNRFRYAVWNVLQILQIPHASLFW